MFKSAIVKIRSQRRYRAVKNPKGNIYLPSSWVGKKVKVVDRIVWVSILKRIHKLEHQLAKIRKISK